MANFIIISLEFRKGNYADGLVATHQECCYLMNGWNALKPNSESQKLLKRSICRYKGLYYIFLVYSKKGKKDTDDKPIYDGGDFRKVINKYKGSKGGDLDKYILCMDGDGRFHSITEESEFYTYFFGEMSCRPIK